MFFLAAALVGWIGRDFVYRKLAANSLHISATASSNCNQVNSRLFAREDFIPGPHISGNLRTRARRSDHFSRYVSTGDMLKMYRAKSVKNKTVVDIRFRPRSGVAPSGSIWVFAAVLDLCYSILSRYCVAYSWKIVVNMRKRDVIHKTGST